jgi:Ca2+-binding RTX toxin-like protein
MRRILMLLVMVTLLAAMCATTAFAKIITGDANNNYLIESPGDDTLKGLQGNDLLNAELWGGYTGRNDSDILKGGRQADVLLAFDSDNNDFLIGGMGDNDRCIGDLGDSFAASCERVSKVTN